MQIKKEKSKINLVLFRSVAFLPPFIAFVRRVSMRGFFLCLLSVICPSYVRHIMPFCSSSCWRDFSSAPFPLSSSSLFTLPLRPPSSPSLFALPLPPLSSPAPPSSAPPSPSHSCCSHCNVIVLLLGYYWVVIGLLLG